MQRIAGTFADFKLIKGRKVAQIVVEIPIEQADAIVAALGGLPNPAVERWVAMAPVNMEAARAASSETAEQRSNHSAQGEADSLRVSEGSRPASASPASERKQLSVASKIALTCRQPTFQAFLRQEPGLLGTLWCDARNQAFDNGVDEAAAQPHALAEAAVKKFCGVSRKRDIAERPHAVERWDMVLASYEHWQRRAA
ncbi:hypothetical protein [Methylobacterium sp. Gmos1]